MLQCYKHDLNCLVLRGGVVANKQLKHELLLRKCDNGIENNCRQECEFAFGSQFEETLKNWQLGFVLRLRVSFFYFFAKQNVCFAESQCGGF